VQGVFEESLVNVSSANTAVRGDLLLCNRWQTSAQDASAAKKKVT